MPKELRRIRLGLCLQKGNLQSLNLLGQKGLHAFQEPTTEIHTTVLSKVNLTKMSQVVSWTA